MMAKGKRVRKTAPTLTSRLDMERCVGEIARLAIERDALLCEMDARLQAVRVDYAEQIDTLNGDMEAELSMAREWAEANPAEFGSAKSIEFTHAVAGYRTGMPKLKTIKGYTWDRVLEKLATMRLTEYIRTKAEVDKERILTDREALAEKLPLMGVQVAQDETFFVQPKREDAPAPAKA